MCKLVLRSFNFFSLYRCLGTSECLKVLGCLGRVNRIKGFRETNLRCFLDVSNCLRLC